MKTASTYLLLFCALTAFQSNVQQSGIEPPATEQFLQGNWKLDETRLLASFTDKDGSIKKKDDLSKGLFQEIISFKKDGRLIEYNNLFGRKYPDFTQIKVDKFTAIAGSYALESGILALKASDERTEPAILYYRPIVVGNKLLLKMNLELMVKSGVLKPDSEEIKRAISGSMIMVMSRVKGKIPTWKTPERAPGELDNVSEDDISSVDKP